jgi:ADP-heptose:LPS heptosyltransferase
MKKALVTVSIGEKYKPISDLTHPTFKDYAKRVGADFVVLDKQEVSKTTPQWEKFRIYHLLNKYERILYVDTDLIIRDDCPNLFDLVTEDRIGLFDESRFTDRRGLVQSMADYFGKNVSYNGKYYNTGVMVISRCHKMLFAKPEVEVGNFYEQTFFNMRLFDEKVKIKNLDYKFNRMTCIDGISGVSRLDAYIVHYAGCPDLDLMTSLMKKDLTSWKYDKERKYPQRVFVSVSGGLGDQINAQPAIRFMREKVLLKAEIIVATHYPRIFRDIKGIKVYMQGEFKTQPDTPYCVLDSFPPPKSATYAVMGNLLCHTVDYCSMALLKRNLPFEDKNIKLNVSLKDIQKAIEVVGIRDLRDLVLIHPGKHWESKTMPKKWWEEIIDGLAKEKVPVCIIGKTGDPGVWHFEEKKGVINTIDLLDLDALIALIAQAKVLVTSDSAPIHIAGAFDNWIIAIPTVKHPDHILPFRHSSVYHKTDVLYKKLVLDDYSTSPFEVNEVAVAKLVDTWDNYLVEPKVVIEKIKERYNN